MEKQEISFKLGARLKALRESFGLSYQELADRLFEQYEVKISKDSLRDYEISEDFRAKAKKLPNMGMKTEYLYVLACFYGVSVDWLLGFTDTKSPESDLRIACEYTGLCEEAAEFLNFISDKDENGIYYAGFSDTCYNPRDLVNEIFSSGDRLFFALVDFCDGINNISAPPLAPDDAARVRKVFETTYKNKYQKMDITQLSTREVGELEIARAIRSFDSLLDSIYFNHEKDIEQLMSTE